MKTLICPMAKEVLRSIGNVARKDLTMIHGVDRLPKNFTCATHALTRPIDETPPKTNTQCAFKGLEIIKCSLPISPFKPIEICLPNLVAFKISSDHHHPPNHKPLILL
jgi:hypothetical protein